MKKKKRSGKGRTKKTKSAAKKFSIFLTKAAIITALILLSLHAFIDLFEKDLFDFLVKQVEKNSQGLYIIKYDSVGLDFFKRSIHLRNLSIDLDQKILNRLKTTPSQKKTLFQTSLPVLTLEGISIIDLLFRKSLNINKLLLNRGKLKIIRMKSREKKAQGSSLETKTSRGKINKKLKPWPAVHIRHVQVENISFQLADPFQKDSILDISDLSLVLSALEVYPKGESDPGTNFKTYFSFESGKAIVKGLKYNTPNGFYMLKAKNIDFSQSTASLSVDTFELIPRYSKYQFARIKGYQTDRFQFSVHQISCRDLDFNDLFKNQRLSGRWLLFENPRLEIFRDKHIPRRQNPSPKKFPHQWLREFKFKFRIHHIKITNGHLTYEEQARDEKKAGKVFFNEIQAHLTNVTNYPESLEKNLSLGANTTTRLMGKSILKTSLTLPINNRENRFTIAGSLEKTDMKAFNSILEPNAHLRIRSGTIDKLEFSATFDSHTARGKMKLHYKNLKISLLKPIEGGTYRKKRLTSLLANLIIHQHNPIPGEPLKEGQILFKKEKSMAFFAYIWKALLSGIKSSIGL